MSKPADPKLIGAFVLGAALLIIVGLVVVGGGKFFKRTVPVVMYFQGSVSGLSAGSAVNFRGVRLGQVTNVYIRYQPDSRESLIIPVFAELNADNLQFVLTRRRKEKDPHGQRRYSSRAHRPRTSGAARFAEPGAPVKRPSRSTCFPELRRISSTSTPIGSRSRRCRRRCRRCRRRLQQLYDKFSQLPLEELVSDARDAGQGRQPSGQ